MAQSELVDDQIESGKRLIAALTSDDFQIPIYFWAKPTEDAKWYLYLASPLVDEKGPTVAYRRISTALRGMPDLWIDPFDVKAIGVEDGMAKAARARTTPRVQEISFAVESPKPYQGMTWFGGPTLGGVSIDGALIYPPPQPATSS